MPTDRVTVSLGEETKATLEGLADRTGESQSQLICEAIAFYATNFD